MYVAGVIMVHLGIDLLIGTLLKSGRNLNNLEYVCMLLVGLVVSTFGFVEGTYYIHTYILYITLI